MRKSITVVMLAMLTIGSFGFIPNLANADTFVVGTWVRMLGIITQWDVTPVFGFIGAHAAMVNKNGTYHEWARVHAIWSFEPPSRLNCTKPPTENVTFTFYAAGLVNSTKISLNNTVDNRTDNLYISGLWNVRNVTTTILIYGNGTIEVERLVRPMVYNATGELHVFDNWSKFVLYITGIPLLKGWVKRADIFHAEIKMCDVDGDGDVDLIDLVKVAKRYRTVPGLWSENDFHMDFNCNEQIDMGDLTTVAANMPG
jgi:hypothetical protein